MQGTKPYETSPLLDVVERCNDSDIEYLTESVKTAKTDLRWTNTIWS